MGAMNGTDRRDQTEYREEEHVGGTSSPSRSTVENVPSDGEPVVYKVYKIRWFGLMQLVLLNIVVSWDVSDSTSSTTRALP